MNDDGGVVEPDQHLTCSIALTYNCRFCDKLNPIAKEYLMAATLTISPFPWRIVLVFQDCKPKLNFPNAFFVECLIQGTTQVIEQYWVFTNLSELLTRCRRFKRQYYWPQTCILGKFIFTKNDTPAIEKPGVDKALQNCLEY